ncbi:MAG: AraC family transcriptional regulator [Pseudomonadota bacterium]
MQDVLAALADRGGNLLERHQSDSETLWSTKWGFNEYCGDAPGPDDPQIIMVLEGHGRFSFEYDGVSLCRMLYPGQIGLRLPNTAAQSEWPNATLLQIGISRSEFQKHLSERSENMTDRLEHIASSVSDSSDLRRLFLALKRAIESSATDQIDLEQATADFVDTLLYDDEVGDRPIDRREQPLSEMQWRRVRDRINDSLGVPVSVAELAKMCSLSRAHFSKAFQARAGLTPATYVRFAKMREATNRLRYSNQSIIEIALDLGYSNPSKFAAAFRSVIGAAPMEWRSY